MQRSGLLTATARLVAQGETVGTTTSAGTPTALELKRFGHFNGAIARNGTALGNVVSAEITYANNLDRIETIRSDGRIDGADPSIAALTGRIEVRFADQTLVTQAINGEACEMEFAYVLPSGENFTFTVHAVYLPRPRIEISGPQGVQPRGHRRAARNLADLRCLPADLCLEGSAAGTGKKRLRALAEWSFGGGERYCEACAQACPDCSARLNRPETPEGWQVWDLVGRLGGQLRVLPGAVIGWDMSAALALGDALGVPPLAMAELLPVIEAVMVRKLNEELSANGGPGVRP